MCFDWYLWHYGVDFQPCFFLLHIVGLVQDCSTSSVLTMELLQPCPEPSIWKKLLSRISLTGIIHVMTTLWHENAFRITTLCKGIHGSPVNSPPQIASMRRFDSSLLLFRTNCKQRIDFGHPGAPVRWHWWYLWFLYSRVKQIEAEKKNGRYFADKLKCIIMRGKFFVFMVLIPQRFITSQHWQWLNVGQVTCHCLIHKNGHARVRTQQCGFWCPGAQTLGHQYPQCWLNTDCIRLIPYTNISISINLMGKCCWTFCWNISWKRKIDEYFTSPINDQHTWPLKPSWASATPRDIYCWWPDLTEQGYFTIR